MGLAANITIDKHLKLDQNLVRIVDKGICETFSSFLGIYPVQTHVEYCVENCPFKSTDLTGFIAFIQQEVEGTLSLQMKKTTVLNIMGQIFGESVSDFDSKSMGGVAEFLNVIHGIVKEELNLLGYQYQMCLPVVVIGQDHSFLGHKRNKKAILTYDIGGSEFYVVISLKD